MNPPSAHRETRILVADDIRRAVTRISHEIVERNQGAGALVVVGVQTGGVWIAEQIAANISAIEPAREVALGTVDVSMYRDDLALRPVVPAAPTRIPCDLTGATVVLVDNVLYTGRTVRAALEVEALNVIVSAERRLAAVSKLRRVRVLSSKKTLATVRPRSAGTFGTCRVLISAMWSATSRIPPMAAASSVAVVMRCFITPLPPSWW